MTNEQFIQDRTPQLTRKYSAILLELLEKIDRHEMADKIIPGRHITVGHAAKHIICSYVRISYPEADAISTIKTTFDKTGITGSLRLIYQIYALTDATSDSPREHAPTEHNVRIFGVEMEYGHYSGWSCPQLYSAEHTNLPEIKMPFSEEPANIIREYARTKIIVMLDGEIDLSLDQTIDEEAFTAFAHDHFINITLPPGIEHSHQDDIDRWIVGQSKAYRSWLSGVRSNADINEELRSSLQRDVDQWLARPANRIRLCHPHERAIITDGPDSLHLDAKILFVYRDVKLEDNSPFLACAIETNHANGQKIEVYEDPDPGLLYETVFQVLAHYKREVVLRLKLYAIDDPLDHKVNPMAAIILRHATSKDVAEAIEWLRSSHSTSDESFPDIAHNKSIKPFDARIRKDEVQLKFPLGSNVSWEWNALFIDAQMPLSVISGLEGKPLSTIVDTSEVDPELGAIVIGSAKKLQKNIRIDLNVDLIKIKDIIVPS